LRSRVLSRRLYQVSCSSSDDDLVIVIVGIPLSPSGSGIGIADNLIVVDTTVDLHYLTVPPKELHNSASSVNDEVGNCYCMAEFDIEQIIC
jgi:hypothetical protein